MATKTTEFPKINIAKPASPQADLKVPDTTKPVTPAQVNLPAQPVGPTQTTSSIQAFAIQSHQDFTTSQQGFTPAHDPFNPSQQGFTPGKEGFKPGQPGFTPVPVSSGFTSGQTGFVPGQQGFTPDKVSSGFTSGQTGFIPDKVSSGFTSGQTGFTPGQHGFPTQQTPPNLPAFTTQPADPSKPSARPVRRLIGKLIDILKTIFLRTPDKFLIHLNKLFAPAENLTAVISTIYYVLRVLGRFSSPKSPSNLENMPTITAYSAADKLTSPAPTNRIGRSGSMLWNTRMTLRLFRLLPIYARAKELMTGAKPDDDNVLYATSLIQCGLQGVSQLLENAAFLTERRIAPNGFTAAITQVSENRSKTLYTIAYRMWFLAATCEVLRMIRKVHLMWNHASEKVFSGKHGASEKPGAAVQPAKQHPWWHIEFLLPLAWFPVGWQVTGWVEDGSPGFNTALHNVACVLSDIEQAGLLWRANKAVTF